MTRRTHTLLTVTALLLLTASHAVAQEQRRGRRERDARERRTPSHRVLVLHFQHIPVHSFVETMEQLAENEHVADALEGIAHGVNEHSNSLVIIASPEIAEMIEQIADGVDQPNEFAMRERSMERRRQAGNMPGRRMGPGKGGRSMGGGMPCPMHGQKPQRRMGPGKGGRPRGGGMPCPMHGQKPQRRMGPGKGGRPRGGGMPCPMHGGPMRGHGPGAARHQPAKDPDAQGPCRPGQAGRPHGPAGRGGQMMGQWLGLEPDQRREVARTALDLFQRLRSLRMRIGNARKTMGLAEWSRRGADLLHRAREARSDRIADALRHIAEIIDDEDDDEDDDRQRGRHRRRDDDDGRAED